MECKSAKARKTLRHDCPKKRIKTAFKREQCANSELEKLIVTGGNQKPRCSRYRMYPTILPPKELQRLKDAAKVTSLEERLLELEAQTAENNRIMEESEKRKKLLKDIDEAKLKALQECKAKDDDGDDSRQVILERASLAQFEEEEEVKQANRVILEAKCHIIREAQVAEKNELAREMKEEDRKLDKVILDNVEKSYLDDEERAKKHEEEKKKYAEEIQRQLLERNFVRQKEVERIEEEAKTINLAVASMKQDEEKKAEIERQKRTKLREDLNKISQMSQFFKQMEFEQERQAEMQILAYMKNREEREKKIALEKKIAKEAKERQQEKLLMQQAKVLTTKAERTDMILRKEQEKREREFRRKEKEAVIKKKQIIKEINEGRKEQMKQLKTHQAMQIARDEAEFKTIVEGLKAEEAKEKKSEEERLRNKDLYREEIIRQMNIKELERRENQLRARNEYFAWKKKEEERERKIKGVIQMKLNQMREAKLPEKFIKDVEKQLKLDAN